MDYMNHLRDLLCYEAKHLYSAEEQIIEALPLMIDAAHDTRLKTALEQHLAVSERQRERLDEVMQLLGEGDAPDRDRTIFAGLFSNEDKSRGIEGLILEGQKMIAVDMRPEVKDAAIIACAQKIEHYEIAAYGTARSFAQQLGLVEVAGLLQQTLLEEHEADDALTALALSTINERAGIHHDSPSS